MYKRIRLSQSLELSDSLFRFGHIEDELQIFRISVI